MNFNIDTENITCDLCGANVPDAARHCPTCQHDMGAPNVRTARHEKNLEELDKRYNRAQEASAKKDCSNEFDSLSNLIQTESKVIISMNPSVARNLFEDKTEIYSNYEKLVKGGVKLPSSSANDNKRFAVSGTLFGSYQESIVYGALSLSNNGLPTYGAVQCEIRKVAIQNRTSFLEKNSYHFIEEHDMKLGEGIPVGYVCDWENRHKLALSKLASDLDKDQKRDDWGKLLLSSDGTNRDNDEFIEAHIFQGFNGNAIEAMELSDKVSLSRVEGLDFELAFDIFNRK